MRLEIHINEVTAESGDCLVARIIKHTDDGAMETGFSVNASGDKRKSGIDNFLWAIRQTIGEAAFPEEVPKFRLVNIGGVMKAEFLS